MRNRTGRSIERWRPSMQSVCVFCGSSVGHREAYRAAAVDLGRQLAQRRLRLVYGGGGVGLMGVVADAVLQAGGEAIGVIPRMLLDKELGHSGLTQLHIVDSMHQRKALMADLSDAFLAMPGGIGTLEEFCEIFTWSQLGLHHKPFGILNVEAYFSGLVMMFRHAVAEGFLSEHHVHKISVADQPAELLDALASAQPPQQQRRWLDHDAT